MKKLFFHSFIIVNVAHHNNWSVGRSRNVSERSKTATKICSTHKRELRRWSTCRVSLIQSRESKYPFLFVSLCCFISKLSFLCKFIIKLQSYAYVVVSIFFHFDFFHLMSFQHSFLAAFGLILERIINLLFFFFSFSPPLVVYSEFKNIVLHDMLSSLPILLDYIKC